MEKLRRILWRVVLLSLALLFAGSMLLSMAAQGPDKEKAPAKAKYKAGTYTTVGNGRGGPIVVQVKFSPTAITDIKVIAHNESHMIGDVPIDTFPGLIVKNQSLAVDTVSGATISSMALMAAISQAVKDAGGNPAALKKKIPVDKKPAVDAVADVVVVGGGGAGLTAAIHAANAGAKVILLEKLDILGGTASYSIEAAGSAATAVHKGIGATANAKDFYAFLVNYWGPKADPQILEVFANNSGKAMDWLMSIGAQLPVTNAAFGVQPSREVGKMGEAIVSALVREAKHKKIDCRTSSQATKLVMNNGAVAGVQVKGPSGEYTIKSKAVVLATGGFAANNEMVAKYYPKLKGYIYSSSKGATGDGQLMAEAVGAKLRDMDNMRIGWTYYVKGQRVYYTGAMMNTGGILVNNDGKRYINDQASYMQGTKVLEQNGGWMIFDNSIVESVKDVRDYYDQGFFETAPTIRELAKKIGVNEDNLAATVERYQGFVKAGKDADFGRPRLNMAFDEPPFHACKVSLVVQGTFGGIVTTPDTQVISTAGGAIPGLYAAGEVAGPGTWGANPAAANIVFGTIAGQKAAEFARY